MSRVREHNQACKALIKEAGLGLKTLGYTAAGLGAAGLGLGALGAANVAQSTVGDYKHGRMLRLQHKADTLRNRLEAQKRYGGL